MNYNNLQHYVTSEQVYSNDLNQILSKTPPRLFKWALMALAFCLFAALVALTLIRQTKTIDLNYIAYADGKGWVLTGFASQQDYEQARTAATAILRPSNGVATGRLAIDSLRGQLLYESGGQQFEDAATVANTVRTLDDVKPHYKLRIYLSKGTGPALDGGTGRVALVVSEKRLIQKVFGFGR